MHIYRGCPNNIWILAYNYDYVYRNSIPIGKCKYKDMSYLTHNVIFPLGLSCFIDTAWYKDNSTIKWWDFRFEDTDLQFLGINCIRGMLVNMCILIVQGNTTKRQPIQTIKGDNLLIYYDRMALRNYILSSPLVLS